MKKTQGILILGAVALSVLLYQLPRSVVENEQVQEVQSQEGHSLEIPEAVESQIRELRTLVDQEEDINKKTNFAHALARRYLDYGVVDSAAYMAKQLTEWAHPELAADIYFTAYERSPSPEQAKKYAQEASVLLQDMLDKDPANTRIKNRLAMTLVVSDNPMAAIAMLREILAEQPENRQAILNLGLLAIQSGQYDRAKERFEKLVSIDESDHEAKLYLAVSLMEINNQSQARLLLDEILATQDSIPAIKMMASDYLKSM